MKEEIITWIKNYATKHGISHLVVGVSGGIDSAVVSTLCSLTGLKTIVVSMPIHQRSDLHELSISHCNWLADRHPNVRTATIDLTSTFDQFQLVLDDFPSALGLANSRARLRMMCLYQIAQSLNGIVVGTGNKVEDFGVGFFTKYGDGGVDISPIGDLMKTEVWEIGKELGINQKIIDAAPTDGLWSDGRTDQDQLGGLSYPELEHAMRLDEAGIEPHEEKDKILLEKYRSIRVRNLHKMIPIPIFQKVQQ